MNQNRKKMFLKITITVIFLIIVFDKIDYNVLIVNISRFPSIKLGIAFAVALLQIVIGALSLHVIYKKENVLKIFLVTLKSNFYAMFLPGQILGESTKILMLSSSKASISERFSAVAIDKGLNIVSMALVGCFGGLLSSYSNEEIKKYLFGGMILAILGIMFVRSTKVINFAWNLVKKAIRNDAWIEKGQSFLEIWIEYSHRNKEMLISAMWGIAYQLSIVLVYYVLSLGLGLSVGFWDYCWINAILTIILFLPVSISGLGVRETTLIGLLGLLDIASEQAVALSVLILLIQVLRAMLGGIILFLDRGNGGSGGRKKIYE